MNWAWCRILIRIGDGQNILKWKGLGVDWGGQEGARMKGKWG